MSNPYKKAARSRKQEQESDTHVIHAQWKGPLPPPRVLSEFNYVVENGAERLFRMAEKEQEHRHQTDKSDILTQRTGILLGFLISAAAMAGAFFTARMEHVNYMVPIAFLSVPLFSLAKALVKIIPRNK